MLCVVLYAIFILQIGCKVIKKNLIGISIRQERERIGSVSFLKSPHLHYLCIMNQIVITDLAIGYKQQVVAQHLSACLQGGRLTALIGPNGMGKSTLLRTLAGMQPALAGTVTLSDGTTERRLDSLSKHEVSRWIGVVLTDRVDVANTTVAEVVATGRMPYTGFFGHLDNKDRQVVDEAMHLTGISALAHRQVTTLSDGERQKIMIAKALAQQTPVVLLDEPTAFLDYPSKVETLRLLHRLAHETGKIIVLSTHDLNLAMHIADRLLTIADGIEEIGKDRLRLYLERLMRDNP